MELLKAIMERDELTMMEALEEIRDAREQWDECMDDGEDDIDEFMMDIFGLEPDYILDFLTNPRYVRR